MPYSSERERERRGSIKRERERERERESERARESEGERERERLHGGLCQLDGGVVCGQEDLVLPEHGQGLRPAGARLHTPRPGAAAVAL